MFTQTDFGNRLREFRKRAGLTQKEAGMKIAVSEQAISKWENGECLPDVYHLKLLAQMLHVSADCLLDTENESDEKVVETIRVGGAVFEIVEKSEVILAGKILYAKDYPNIEKFYEAINAMPENGGVPELSTLQEMVLPIRDIQLSVNFWRAEESRAYGFVREVVTEHQPQGMDIYKNPASLYIRAYTDSYMAQLMTKEECETWELFTYIRDYFMPNRGFTMADNGAQELEVFDTSEHRSGYAYMPVMRVTRQ